MVNAMVKKAAAVQLQQQPKAVSADKSSLHAWNAGPLNSCLAPSMQTCVIGIADASSTASRVAEFISTVTKPPPGAGSSRCRCILRGRERGEGLGERGKGATRAAEFSSTCPRDGGAPCRQPAPQIGK